MNHTSGQYENRKRGDFMKKFVTCAKENSFWIYVGVAATAIILFL